MKNNDPVATPQTELDTLVNQYNTLLMSYRNTVNIMRDKMLKISSYNEDVAVVDEERKQPETFIEKMNALKYEFSKLNENLGIVSRHLDTLI